MNQVQNQVTLIGYLGTAPEVIGEGDTAGTSFRLATSETFRQGDEQRERTDWHRIVCWNGLSTSSLHLAKGDRVAVFGKLRSNDWTDSDGTKQRSIEVHATDLHFLRVKSFAERQAKKAGKPEAKTSRRKS